MLNGTWRQVRRILTNVLSEHLASLTCVDAPLTRTLFRNQRVLPQLIARILDQFPGFGPENFGSLVMHVQLAMRDREGIVLRDEYIHPHHHVQNPASSQ